MANTTLFRSLMGALIPRGDARNDAGGPAYTLPPQHALAQYAATGCLNTTFYATAESQLDRCPSSNRLSPCTCLRGTA